MKRLFPIMLAFMTALLVPAPLLAAGASGVPTWSQHFTKGRFTVLPQFNGEAVLDKETGLVWEQSPDDVPHSWFAALDRCYVVNHGDRLGWRLPTIEELASLIDTSVAGSPKLSAGNPFLGVSGSYWSATTLASDQARAWGLSIDDSSMGDLGKGNDGAFKRWCVRGSQGVDGVQLQ